MDNTQNIKYMLANPKPDLSDLEDEIRSIFNTPEFTLNALQVNALAIICKYGCLFGNLPVGSGKTIVSLAAGLVHRSKRCLLFVPSDLIAQLTIVDIKHFETILGRKLDWCCLDGKSQKDRIHMMDKHRITIIPYSLLSTKDTFDLIEASYADMVVFDECFTAATKISTPKGEISIDKVRLGDMIYNATGTGIVEAISKKSTKQIYEIGLSNGRKIRCTGNHPFLSEQGWIEARNLGKGSKLFSIQNMPELWKRISTLGKNSKWCKSSRRSTVFSKIKILRNILFKEIGKSYVENRCKRKDDKNTEKDRTQTINSWWQRWSDRNSNKDVRFIKSSNIRRLDSRDTYINERVQSRKNLPNLLQSGLRSQRKEISNRIRWSDTLRRTVIKRQKERRFSNSVRVESIEIKERGSGECVYNLQVSQHPSYFAEGVLVHNCHVLSDNKSARTRRIMSYLNKNTEINVILLSGTMASKSLLDYHHTIARALHQFCPLPFSYYDVKLIQDATAWDREDKFTKCIPLCRINPKLDQGGGIVNVDKARKFLRTLLNASPCVIISDAQSVNCSMMVHVIDDVKLPEKLIKIIDEVDATWTTPSGDLIMDAIVKYGICSELSDGFWYRKYWPKGTPDWAIELFSKEKELESMIRSFILKRHRDKLDTPLLVYEALYHGNDPRLERIQPFYNEFRQECEKHDEEFERKSETRWICHSKEKEAIKWCKGRKKGILFYEWDATGESLYKTLKEQGFDVVFCPSNCEPELLKKNCFQVMSYAHHRGKNLQHQFETLFYNLPKNAKILEQAMGRTHRQGQKADCVSYWFILATKQDRAAFRRIILKAKWQETTMQQQKILIASFAQPEYAELVRE